MVDHGNVPGLPAGLAYVLPGLGVGGAERHVRHLVERLDRGTFSPRVISTAGTGPMEEEYSRLGVPVHVLDYRGVSLKPGSAGPLFRRARSFFRDFAGILAANDVRILHCYLPSANVLGMAAGMFSRTAVRIVSKRALCRYKEGHPVFSLFEDLANLAAHAVLVNSEAVARDVRRNERFLGGKIVLVHNGIDPADSAAGRIDRLVPEMPWNEGDPVVTYVANLFPYKGHLDLVSAAAIVVEAIPEVRFLLVGRDSGAREALLREVSSRGLEQHVHLAGERKDAVAILASSTLAVHPSHEEGFSNTILEAMAAGKAVVATRTGGTPEAVIDGETGLLVPQRDPEALANALLTLLRDSGSARAMGRAGRQRVLDHYSVGKMVAAMEQTYLELLAGRPLSCRA